MTVVLIREDVRYERKFTFRLHDKPRLSHPDYHTIEPFSAVITVYREKEHDPWTLDWVVVTGSRVLASGKVGTSDVQHYYTWHKDGSPDSHAPDWLVTLVVDTFEEAERDRVRPHAQPV